jgi:Zn-dependent M16 (insulinase) family peptidase
MLEHMTLQGSANFPIRSVFSELHKRPYASFMNAWTFREFTAYPFSTTNESDFHNDLSVYLDSVFHPRLREIDFRNECHHLYFEDNDIAKPLKRGGVVYNEMRGAYSNPASVIYNQVNELLYPDSASRFVSGGRPEVIPRMTIEGLREKHALLYHPSNAHFFWYGNFPLQRVLDKVSSVIDPFPAIERQLDNSRLISTRWDSPRKAVREIPTDPADPSSPKQWKAVVRHHSQSRQSR